MYRLATRGLPFHPRNQGPPPLLPLHTAMILALLVTAPPQHEQAWHALHFCEAAIAKGHTIERVFFYGDGVLHGNLLNTAARASVRSEIAEEVADYTESGISASAALVEVFGELPELRDAMNLAWRILILWLAVIALFVVAGWVS